MYALLANQQTYVYETHILAGGFSFQGEGGRPYYGAFFALRQLRLSHETYPHTINLIVIQEYWSTQGIPGSRP